MRHEFFFTRFPAPVGIFFIAFLMAGCAAPQTRALLQQSDSGLPAQFELDGVPFFPQEAYQCGPAALAMALNAAGARVVPEALIPQVYLPGRRGSLQAEMLAAARRNGMVAYELPASLEDLLFEVAGGTPVVVLQNLGLSWYPIWHYALVVGFDINRGEIILRSGREPRLVMAMTTFEHTWMRSGYWAMLVLPPERLPKKASRLDYIKAAVALEKAGQLQSAQTAYTIALSRWSDELTALIGLGNTSYALGDFEKAEQIFRRATTVHPESAAAFNNLAQTLAYQGRYSEAIQAAREAVNLGGPHWDAVKQTLQDILVKPGQH